MSFLLRFTVFRCSIWRPQRQMGACCRWYQFTPKEMVNVNNPVNYIKKNNIVQFFIFIFIRFTRFILHLDPWFCKWFPVILTYLTCHKLINSNSFRRIFQRINLLGLIESAVWVISILIEIPGNQTIFGLIDSAEFLRLTVKFNLGFNSVTLKLAPNLTKIQLFGNWNWNWIFYSRKNWFLIFWIGRKWKRNCHNKIIVTELILM